MKSATRGGMFLVLGSIAALGCGRRQPPANAPPHAPEKPILSLLPSPFQKDAIALRVEKSLYRLTVLYNNTDIKSYAVVFGDPIGDKRYEGDRRTPEGEFRILERRKHRSWAWFLLLDYPNAESRRRFQERKAKGEIPNHAAIGSAIGIHGVPEGGDSAIANRQNWTHGCVSLTRAGIAEIANVAQRGTPVQILP